MGLDSGDDSTEHGGGNDVNLVKEDESPLARGEKVHHLLRIVRALLTIGDHRVGRDYDSSVADEL